MTHPSWIKKLTGKENVDLQNNDKLSKPQENTLSFLLETFYEYSMKFESSKLNLGNKELVFICQKKHVAWLDQPHTPAVYYACSG